MDATVKMPSKTSIYRRKMKEEDPEKYEAYRKKERERSQARRNKKKENLLLKQPLTAEVKKKREGELEGARRRGYNYQMRKKGSKETTAVNAAKMILKVRDPQKMLSKQSIYRRKMKEEDPEKYEAYRKKEKERSQARRDKKKENLLKQPLTEELKRQKKRELEDARWRNNNYQMSKECSKETTSVKVAEKISAVRNAKRCSAAARYRRRMKENDPEKWEAFKVKERERCKAYRAKRKEKWLKQPLTAELKKERERFLEAARRKNHDYYWKKVLSHKDGAKTLLDAMIKRLCPDGRKRPRDMTTDEFRLHKSRLRNESRTRQSAEARELRRKKDREYRRRKRLEASGRSHLDPVVVLTRLKLSPERVPSSSSSTPEQVTAPEEVPSSTQSPEWVPSPAQSSSEECASPALSSLEQVPASAQSPERVPSPVQTSPERFTPPALSSPGEIPSPARSPEWLPSPALSSPQQVPSSTKSSPERVPSPGHSCSLQVPLPTLSSFEQVLLPVLCPHVPVPSSSLSSLEQAPSPGPDPEQSPESQKTTPCTPPSPDLGTPQTPLRPLLEIISNLKSRITGLQASSPDVSDLTSLAQVGRNLEAAAQTLKERIAYTTGEQEGQRPLPPNESINSENAEMDTPVEQVPQQTKEDLPDGQSVSTNDAEQNPESQRPQKVTLQQPPSSSGKRLATGSNSSSPKKPPASNQHYNLLRFPLRVGITWQKGERLEAMDFSRTWYPSKIVEIDEEDKYVLIHFEGWNSRYDEWVPMDSDKLRPQTRHSERKDKGNKKRRNLPQPIYRAGEQVLARWTDCKKYPATVNRAMDDGSYEVVFFDGVTRLIQPINIQPMPEDRKLATQEALKPLPASAGVKSSFKDIPLKLPDNVLQRTKSIDEQSEPAASVKDLTPEEAEMSSQLKKPGLVRSSLKTSPLKKKKFKTLPGLIKRESDTSRPLPATSTSSSQSVSTSVTSPAQSETVPLEAASTSASMTDAQGISTYEVQNRSGSLVMGIKRVKKRAHTDSSISSKKKKAKVKKAPTAESSSHQESVRAKSFDLGVPSAPASLPPLQPQIFIPSKAFVVEEDHNHFKCSYEGCTKAFRKENLLNYHIKYYHTDPETSSATAVSSLVSCAQGLTASPSVAAPHASNSATGLGSPSLLPSPASGQSSVLGTPVAGTRKRRKKTDSVFNSAIMPHPTTLARRKMREEDPERFQEFRRKQRERDNKRNAEKKRRWEAEPHTRAQLLQRQEELEAKRARERERYHTQKMSSKRILRTTCATPSPQPATKRPKDMTPDEYRAYRAEQKRILRSKMSHEKKTALRLKRREKRLDEREAKFPAATQNTTPEAGPSGTQRLMQSLYNLNNEDRQIAKKLDVTSEEYVRSILNLLNTRTSEKRAAIREEERKHPARSLFKSQEEPTLPFFEEEMGVKTIDSAEYGPPEEEVIQKPLHNEIKLFYRRDDVSRMLPHARYSSKHGAARVMTCTVKDAHTQFLEESQGKVSRTLFQSLRPKNVRLMGSVALESCLCIYCTNVRLKVGTLNTLLAGSGQIPAEKDMLNFLTCPYEGRWPSILCIDGKCTHCSDRMRPFHIFCRDIIGNTGLKWDRWERNEEGKVEPVRKEGNIRELLKELEKDICEPTKGCSFLQHLFVAYWQYSQFKACRTSPDDGEVVMVQDFGENRKAAYSSEVKSAHFGKQQITVHPVVCFYRSGDTVVRESLLFLSDDTTHDHHAVREFTLKTVDYLRTKVTIKKLTIWSDGAASQYEGRDSFHDLSLLPYSPQRCFYGSEHEKGEADGEIGILSQALRRATYQGHNFSCARDMVEYLSKHFGTDRRHYILVDQVDRTDPEDEVLSIPGTRKYHQFATMKLYLLRARRLACFCSACREDRPQQCLNIQVVGTYDIHKCKPSTQTVLNEAFMEPEASVPQIEIPVSQSQCPKVGDYVKLRCQVNKAQKIYYAVVISVNSDEKFSVRFLQKSGTKYSFGEHDDEGLITPGPPDYYSWTLLSSEQWTMDHRGSTDSDLSISSRGKSSGKRQRHDSEISVTGSPDLIPRETWADVKLKAVADSPLEDNVEPEEVAMEADLVHCVCGITETNGLMIQCDVCMCWQHFICVDTKGTGIPPTNYVCLACEKPKGVRDSCRYMFDMSFERLGELPSFSFSSGQNHQTDSKMIHLKNVANKCNALSSVLLGIKSALHSTRRQVKISKEEEDREFQLWQTDWDNWTKPEEDLTLTPHSVDPVPSPTPSTFLFPPTPTPPAISNLSTLSPSASSTNQDGNLKSPSLTLGDSNIPDDESVDAVPFSPNITPASANACTSQESVNAISSSTVSNVSSSVIDSLSDKTTPKSSASASYSKLTSVLSLSLSPMDADASSAQKSLSSSVTPPSSRPDSMEVPATPASERKLPASSNKDRISGLVCDLFTGDGDDATSKLNPVKEHSGERKLTDTSEGNSRLTDSSSNCPKSSVVDAHNYRLDESDRIKRTVADGNKIPSNNEEDKGTVDLHETSCSNLKVGSSGDPVLRKTSESQTLTTLSSANKPSSSLRLDTISSLPFTGKTHSPPSLTTAAILPLGASTRTSSSLTTISAAPLLKQIGNKQVAPHKSLSIVNTDSKDTCQNSKEKTTDMLPLPGEVFKTNSYSESQVITKDDCAEKIKEGSKKDDQGPISDTKKTLDSEKLVQQGSVTLPTGERQDAVNSTNHISELYIDVNEGQSNTDDCEEDNDTDTAEESADPYRNCEHNLLVHISNVHSDMEAQLLEMERNITDLEKSNLSDPSIHLCDDNVLNDIPALRKSLRKLQHNLAKVQQLSSMC